MLDSNVITRIREYIDAELNPRQQTLGIALRDCISSFSKRGVLQSSMFVHACGEVCCNELTVRGHIVWNAVRRTYGSMVGRLDDQTLSDLHQQIAEYLHRESQRVASQGCERIKWDGTRWHGTIKNAVSERCRELVATLSIEAQFYVDELRQTQEKQAAGDTPGMVFNAPVGAVQTGAFATAHISLSGAEADCFVAALEELKGSLADNGEIQNEQREQAQELADDLLIAVRADKPNPPRIGALFGGLAQTVRTVASLRPAWETVRDAAIAIGLWIT